MAVQTFSLYTNELITNAIVDKNGTFDALVSAAQPNNGGMSGIKVIAEFSEFTPDPAEEPTSFALVTSVESSNNNGQTWFPLVTQFAPLVNPELGDKIVLVAAPNIFNPDEGVPYDDWNGSRVISRTSRRQETLGALFRIRVYLTENGHGTPGAFQQCRVTISGERFDA